MSNNKQIDLLKNEIYEVESELKHSMSDEEKYEKISFFYKR